MSVAASMEMGFFRAEALLALEMSWVHPQTSAGLAQASFTSAHSPAGIHSASQAESSRLAEADFHVMLATRGLPAKLATGCFKSGIGKKERFQPPDLINSLPPNDSQLRQTNTHIHYQV